MVIIKLLYNNALECIICCKTMVIIKLLYNNALECIICDSEKILMDITNVHFIVQAPKIVTE